MPPSSQHLFPPSTENFLRRAFFLSTYAYFTYRVVFRTLHASRTATVRSSNGHAVLLFLHSVLESICVALIVLPFWRRLCNRAMFVPMSTGSVFLRRFTTKTIIAQLFASDVERNGGNARRKKTSAFVTGGEFGGGRKAKEDAKNLNAGGERMTLSIESNAHKLERMTPVFCRELMAFVSANKSELYEKKRKKKSGGGSGNDDGSGSNAVVSRRENEEDFRQPTSQFLSIFGIGTNNNSSSDNMTLALTDESCIRPSELAKKHFPALMNALRDVNGMNVRLVALRPSYR